jgi:uncharacterized protein (DUF2141 family)
VEWIVLVVARAVDQEAGCGEMQAVLGNDDLVLLRLIAMNREASQKQEFMAMRATLAAALCALIVFAATSSTHRLAAQVPGGKADSKVCQLVLKLARSSFKEGAPIKLDLVFRNLSKHSITIWFSGFWPNHQIKVVNEQGQMAPMTAFGERCWSIAGKASRERDKNYPRVVSPGGTLRDGSPADLTTLYTLKPGKYTVTVVYHDEQGPTPIKAVSNPVEFEVLPR